jgi:hypothetical protein
MARFKREIGFYWVKLRHRNEWEPAQWVGGLSQEWFILAQGEGKVVDSDLSVIGDLIQPPKVPEQRDGDG